MLAPLEAEARLRIERECPDAPGDNKSPKNMEEMDDLRSALRESRARLRRSAWESTRIITRLHGEIHDLQARCAHYQEQLANYESGVAMIEMGRTLVRLHEQVDYLAEAARRSWTLERTLEATQAEYQHLAAERDELVRALHLANYGPSER